MGVRKIRGCGSGTKKDLVFFDKGLAGAVPALDYGHRRNSRQGIQDKILRKLDGHTVNQSPVFFEQFAGLFMVKVHPGIAKGFDHSFKNSLLLILG
jgi:hypothetical protein